MEISTLKAMSRPLKVVLDDGEGTALGEIIFRYLPSAITKNTLPAFVAIDDEPLARAQRDMLRIHLEREDEKAALAAGEVLPKKAKAKSPEELLTPEPLTLESLEMRIDKRRAEQLQPNLQRLELAAKKLCMLLDPEKGHDLTHEGERLPVTWETFADSLPVALIEAVTLSILEAMKDPFGLVSSLRDSLNGAYDGLLEAAPASGEN